MNDIIIRIENATGRITLNRPKAMNALSWEMALKIEQALQAWRDDETVEQVLIDATGDRAFCAGGDIVNIYEEGKSGSSTKANQFWRDEYRLNAMIAAYPKPYIAVMDGFVMGGGVGISAHGSHRVVTNRTQFAMPECGIGLNPDVGGTLILARMPGHFGEYFGLTGARLSGIDCMAMGVGTHFVGANELDGLKASIVAEGLSALDEVSQTQETSQLLSVQAEIDSVFHRDDLADIIVNCKGSDILDKAGEMMARNAPLAMIIALHTIRLARVDDNIKLALMNEYRASSRALVHGEMVEGIRAAVIDKDRDPKWKYPKLEDVPKELIHLMKSTPEGGDLEL